MELETRKASMKKRMELEVAKVELKLKEEEISRFQILNQKFQFELNMEFNDSIDSDHRVAEEVTPRLIR